MRLLAIQFLTFGYRFATAEQVVLSSETIECRDRGDDSLLVIEQLVVDLPGAKIDPVCPQQNPDDLLLLTQSYLVHRGWSLGYRFNGACIKRRNFNSPIIEAAGRDKNGRAEFFNGNVTFLGFFELKQKCSFLNEVNYSKAVPKISETFFWITTNAASFAIVFSWPRSSFLRPSISICS